MAAFVRSRSTAESSVVIASSRFRFQSSARLPVSTHLSIVASVVAGEVAGSVGGRVSALDALDISLPALLVRYGAADIIMDLGVLAALGVWLHSRRSLPVSPVIYVASLVPFGGMLVLFAASGAGQQIIWYVVVVSLILVPLATLGFVEARGRLPRRTASVALASLLCVGLLVSILVIHPESYGERPVSMSQPASNRRSRRCSTTLTNRPGSG